MKSIKVLIWNSFPLKERQGGPSTYLFNLKKSIEQNNINYIHFVNDYKEKQYKKSRKSIFFSKKVKPFISKVFSKQTKKREKKKNRTLEFLTKKYYIT